MSRAGTDDETQTYAYVLRAQPSAAGPQLALLHLQLDDVTRRLAEIESSRDQITALLEEERAVFQDEIGRGADELEHLQNKLSQVTDERSALRDDIARLHRRLARVRDELAVAKTAVRQLAAIRQSRSYRWSRGLARAAHVVVTPVRSLRRRR